MDVAAGVRALAICGPTASGKSELASQLAQAIGGEIINADSRQIYAGMRIGTGWPSGEQMARAPHHGYGILPPNERYNAGRFVNDAREIIAQVHASGRVPILVGGTGLYIEALAGSMPLDRPVADDELRERIRREAAVHPHDALREWLSVVAPVSAARVMPGDRYRTLRALEAALAGRLNLSRFAQHANRGDAVQLDIVVLEIAREPLHARIQERVQSMFDAGLVGEAQAIARAHPDAPALTGIGYAEALAYAAGLATRNEAIAGAVKRTRAYAKRQETWFRRLASAARVSALDPGALRTLQSHARESATAT